ncbi:hypothetical protein [Microbacterium nymphoidis]|uniref:hypothetical protein n=1 Tax=Microbacterium nymphoidis TaxID=2898586 RepID=UPI001E5BF784|nr:hypothetical protein [Microbacterium nymphoidis]MCD2498062.1 hypothetical protein [Microbacterium nymphoidis]
MFSSERWFRFITVLAALVVAGVGTAGCVPQVHLTSPVGVWRAAPSQTGVLQINEDGTFTITDSSFDLGSRQKTARNYSAEGRWDSSIETGEVYLAIHHDYRGDLEMGGTGGYSREFMDGRIVFESEDLSITFVYDPSASPTPSGSVD